MNIALKLKQLPEELMGLLDTACLVADQLNLRIYLVGGVVRDLLLKRINFDLDIVVQGDAITFCEHYCRKINAAFKKHHAFGTATVYCGKQKIDFATARQENYCRFGALPQVKPAELKEDLYRRDFTINAMAISLNKDDYAQLIDFYGGYTDLTKGLIRVLNEKSFLDDPTRILRAIRFEQRFNFKLERETAVYLSKALQQNALNLVHKHRLRDELILGLKEPAPEKYIKRLAQVTGFSFIDKKIHLTKDDFSLLSQIKPAIIFYHRQIIKHRKLDEWVIYLAALMYKLLHGKITEVIKAYGMRQSENIRIVSIVKNFTSLQRLRARLKPSAIYKILNPLSFEIIVFFYAYYRQANIRKQIAYFFNHLAATRLLVRGQDLQQLKISPVTRYGKILENLLYAKMDKALHTKEEELFELKRNI